MKQRSAFTLVEILVSVVIIGIISAIAVPVYLHQRINGWKGTVVSDVHSTAQKIELAAYKKNGNVTSLATNTADSNKTIGKIIKTFEFTAGGDNTIGSQTITLNKGNSLNIYIGDQNGYQITGYNSNVKGWKYVYSSLRSSGEWVKDSATPDAPTPAATGQNAQVPSIDGVRLIALGRNYQKATYRAANTDETTMIQKAITAGTLDGLKEHNNSTWLTASGAAGDYVIKVKDAYFLCGNLTTVNGRLKDVCSTSQDNSWFIYEGSTVSDYTIMYNNTSAENFILKNDEGYICTYGDIASCLNTLVDKGSLQSTELGVTGDIFMKEGIQGRSIAINPDRKYTVDNGSALFQNVSTTNDHTVTLPDGSQKVLKPKEKLYVDVSNTDISLSSDDGFTFNVSQGN
jgi:type IV pilus assembly protein PilA